MALPSAELNDLKLRCQKAMARGFEVGKGDSYLTELSAEIGQKVHPGTKATPAVLLDLINQVEGKRAGKPVKKAAPPPAPPPPPPAEAEDEDDEEDEEDSDDVEDEKKSSPTASKKKPSGGKKKKR